MKVLFLTNLPAPYRVKFFSELGKMCDLTVVYERKNAADRDEKWIESATKTYKEFYLHGKNIGTDNSLCPGILRIVASEKYDQIVVGMYSTYTAMLAIMYMKLRRIPFWISTDGGFIKNEGRARTVLKRTLISAAKGWLTPGEEAANYLVYYGADQAKCYSYPFSSVSDADVLKKTVSMEEKSSCRINLGIKENKMILSVGQFIPRKGFDVLLESWKNADSDYGVYIVGGEPTDDYLKMCQQLGLHNVHFVGFKTKDELTAYYKAADVFVLPTREDVWGLVINEALANGLPVVTTDKCLAGVELLKGKECGELVKPDDPEALMQAVRNMLNKPDSVNEEALRIARQYTIEKMAERHMQILSE